MNELLTSARKQLLYWKLLIFNGALYCTVTVGTAIMTALVGVKWTALDGQQKVMIVIGISVSVATALRAFTDKTLSRLQKDQPLVGSSGDTQQFTK